jgi:UDP-N-acetylmuramate dehydrogenase
MFKPKENVKLAKYTTFGTGGPARYFYDVGTIKELKDSVLFAKENNLEIKVLGEGSNVLISDGGIDCFVLKMNIKGICTETIDKRTRVFAYSGEKFDDVISFSVKNNLYGLENLSFIPGTVGASPVHNIGAYGVEVGDVIEWVEVLNIDTNEIYRLSNKECCFKYRESIFKYPKNKNLIILRVSFLLNKNKDNINIDYEDIKSFFIENSIKVPTLNKIRNAIICVRKQKLPDIKKIGNAGSFFKNPIVSKKEIKKLSIIYPKLVTYPHDESHGKISAGWLIDKVGGWKGHRDNDSGVYDFGALVLVNYGSATSKDIFSLAEKIRIDIKEKTNIDLEYEVNLIGNL